MTRAPLIAAALLVAGCSFEVAPLGPVDGGQEETCVDKIKNQDETDVDCGGAHCPKCLDGRACKTGDDCSGGSCVGGTCSTASCSDKMRNGDESDVDCGGSVCPKCMDGKTCRFPGDCAGGLCTSGKCASPSCTDMMKNGGETDVDCGGPSCPKCDVNQGCMLGSDCQSGSCVMGKCSGSCTDGTKNGMESDVDCGGPTCPRCGEGKTCASPTDCLSGLCTATCGAGLVAYWSFDEGQGTTAKDSSGNGNNGTLMGVATWTSGKVKGALQFTNGLVTVPHSQSLNIAGNFTIALWAEAEAYADYFTILNKTSNDNWTDGYGIYSQNGTPSNICGFRTNLGQRACGPMGAAMAFHHLALVYDQVNLIMYVDGVPVGTTPLTGPVATNMGSLLIGKAGTHPWNGKLDEIRVFNRNLTPVEVLQLFNNP